MKLAYFIPESLKNSLYFHQYSGLSWMLFHESYSNSKEHEEYQEINFISPDKTNDFANLVQKVTNFPEKNQKNQFEALYQKIYSTTPAGKQQVFYYSNFTRELFCENPQEKPNKGGILADEMGSGKTITCISLILAHRKENSPTLIVTPVSIMTQWRKEIEKFSLTIQKLKVLELCSTKIEITQNILSFDVVLISFRGLYSHYLQLIEKKTSVFYDIHWFRVIIDEAHKVFLRKGKHFSAICALNADFRWCLTGTPVSNHFDDLYTYVSFLRVPYFKDFKNWTSSINFSLLIDIFRGILLRRTKENAILPLKTEEICNIHLSPFEKELYECELLNKEVSMNYFSKISGLRKILTHPSTFGQDIQEDSSTKLAKLHEFLQEIVKNNDKCIVFTLFLSFFPYIIKNCLTSPPIGFVQYCGNLSKKQRDDAIEEFIKNPNICCFLCTMQSAAVGLNLTAANHVFIMEPWWNPNLEIQAIERVYRYGQTKNVRIVRFVCDETIDDRVQMIKEEKKTNINGFLSQV